MLLVLVACDDFATFHYYPVNSIQTKIEKSSYNVGDYIFFDEDFSQYCLVHWGDDLNKYISKPVEMNYSEGFFFVVEKESDKEKISLIHKDWLQIEGYISVCGNQSDPIVVDTIKNRKIYARKG